MLTKSRVKYIQSLSQKKFRREADVFLVEGPKCVAEMLEEAPGALEAVYALPGWAEAHPSVPFVEVVTAAELAKISQLATPNQVLALVKKPSRSGAIPAAGVPPVSGATSIPGATPPAEAMLTSGTTPVSGATHISQATPIPPGITLFLETIQDPGNMGTILRLADWFGISTVAATPDSVDFFHPKVVQSTMGSILRVQCLEMDLGAFFAWKGSTPVLGATLQGKDIREVQPPSDAVLVIGNESRGISDALLAAVDRQIMIPRFGKAESLNAAMATGILLGWMKLGGVGG